MIKNSVKKLFQDKEQGAVNPNEFTIVLCQVSKVARKETIASEFML